MRRRGAAILFLAGPLPDQRPAAHRLLVLHPPQVGVRPAAQQPRRRAALPAPVRKIRRPGRLPGPLCPKALDGKTTTVRILSTLIEADGGRAGIAGHDLAAEPG